MKPVVPIVVAIAAAALAAGCGEQRDRPVQPPPLGHVGTPESGAPGTVPDTRIMGGAGQPTQCAPLSAQEVLQRINAARASGHRCGPRAMGPVNPLKWDPSLYHAASGHSLDMAKRNYFEHRSPEGADVASRASATHYNWKSVGENIAGGDRTLDDAMRGWLNSPEHCENIMDPRYNDVAVACVAQPGTQWGTYWTMVLGRKR